MTDNQVSSNARTFEFGSDPGAFKIWFGTKYKGKRFDSIPLKSRQWFLDPKKIKQKPNFAKFERLNNEYNAWQLEQDTLPPTSASRGHQMEPKLATEGPPKTPGPSRTRPVVSNAGLRHPTTVSQIAVGSKTTEQRQQNTPRLAQTKLALNRTPLGEVRLHIKPPSPPPLEYFFASKATTRKPPSKQDAAGKGTAASNTMFRQMSKTISGNQHAADQAMTVKKESPAEGPIFRQMSKNIPSLQHTADQAATVQKCSSAKSTYSKVNPSKGMGNPSKGRRDLSNCGTSVNPRKRSSTPSPEKPAKAGVTAASTSKAKNEVLEATPPPAKRRKTNYRAPSPDPSSSQSSVHSPWRPLVPLNMARNAGHDFRSW